MPDPLIPIPNDPTQRLYQRLAFLEARIGAIERQAGGDSFLVKVSTAGQNIAAGGTDTLIDFDTVVFDNGGAFDITTNIWTPKTAGTYLVGGQWRVLDLLNSGERLGLYIYKNGFAGTGGQVISGAQNWIGQIAGGSTTEVETSTLTFMNGTTDNIRWDAWQTDASSRRLNGDTLHNWTAAWGFKVG